MPRAKRICPRPGCPKVAGKRYCPDHEREYEAKRGTPVQRGYDSKHQAERKRWLPIVASGQAMCAKCGNPIQPGTRWDLGHTEDRTKWTGPEHPACNRSEGGQRGRLYQSNG